METWRIPTGTRFSDGTMWFESASQNRAPDLINRNVENVGLCILTRNDCFLMSIFRPNKTIISAHRKFKSYNLPFLIVEDFSVIITLPVQSRAYICKLH